MFESLISQELEHCVKAPCFAPSAFYGLGVFSSSATRKAAPGTTAVLVDGLAPVAFAREVLFLLTYRIPFLPSYILLPLISFLPMLQLVLQSLRTPRRRRRAFGAGTALEGRH